jgi:hypothetical protein
MRWLCSLNNADRGLLSLCIGVLGSKMRVRLILSVREHSCVRSWHPLIEGWAFYLPGCDVNAI